MSTNSTEGTHNKLFLAALLLIIIGLAMAGGFFYAHQKSKPADIMEGKKLTNLLEESKDAHRNVDNILLLKRDHWQLQEKSRDELKEKVPETGGQVIWVKRQLSIGVPVTTDLHGAAEWLKDYINHTELKVVSERPATYNTYESYRIDVGVEVKAGDSYKLYTTDTIYFFHNGNLAKEDKDVIKYPDKPDSKTTVQYQGKMAVIIDGCGSELSPVRTLLESGLPFSYAVLPYKEASSEALQLIKNKDRQVLLDLPLEPLDKMDIPKGSKTIQIGMSEEQIQALVNEALDALPGVSGVVTYQGARASADLSTMNSVLQAVKNRKLFLVDNAASARSIILQEASNLNVPVGRSSIFLDNSESLGAMYEQMQEAAGLADRYGSIIVICPINSVAARAWTRYAKELQKSGITFVPLTDLVN